MWDCFKRAEELPLSVKNLSLQYGNQSLESITISCGVAAFPNHGETPQELWQNADLAWYKAKEQRRDRVISANLIMEECRKDNIFSYNGD